MWVNGCTGLADSLQVSGKFPTEGRDSGQGVCGRVDFYIQLIESYKTFYNNYNNNDQWYRIFPAILCLFSTLFRPLTSSSPTPPLTIIGKTIEITAFSLFSLFFASEFVKMSSKAFLFIGRHFVFPPRTKTTIDWFINETIYGKIFIAPFLFFLFLENCLNVICFFTSFLEIMKVFYKLC